MNNGVALEKFTQQVYTYLLNMKDEGVIVEQNFQLIDKHHISHQIDVFYQFERAGITHKVAIECKNHSRPIENGKVAEFYGKLAHAGNIQKVMVSKSGYQEKAKQMAEAYDILLLTIDELPKINELLAKRLKSVALPDENAIGEPFWTIMEKRQGELTGSYYSVDHPVSHKQNIPLFYSKIHAEREFNNSELSKSNWCIRGMPQHVFRTFLILLELTERRGQGAEIFFLPSGTIENADFIRLPTTREDLIAEYYHGKMPTVQS
ncbi:restriction endonuclease [Psychrobacter proteolyticus]|uniref:restriction endonuclease n=1 Tax=Psychrobacter proteolyticus TaxID=147825 RepID=UPI00311E6BC1